MRRQLPRRGCNATTTGTVKAIVTTVGLVVIGTLPSAAQGAAAAQGAPKDVAYVETVRGRVVASAQGTLLDALDIIGDQTRLDLQANSELRICHYGMRKILKMKGPLQASISESGASAQNSKAIDTTSEACAAPVVSTFQGGFVTRTVGLATANVPLRPRIKVVNQGAKSIRKVALWDNLQRTTLATFERNAASPSLDEGKSYLLVVEQNDGSELKMLLQASRANQTGPLIVVVR